jgi:8-oxo-dGTP diphosphatase
VITYCSDCGTRTQPRQVGTRTLDACPRCERIFFRDPKLVVTALIEQSGRVLLVRRDIEPGRGLWGMPGGYVDWDEHPEAAMVRECREETGVEVAADGLISVQHVSLGDGEGAVVLSYRARLLGGQAAACDETQEVGWFSPGELPRLAFATHANVLSAWAREAKSRGVA